MGRIIGRKVEQSELQRCKNSDHSEFVIVYGRHRIGKTYLIRQFFSDKYAFSYVGIRGVSQQQQLSGFAESLREYGKLPLSPKIDNWFQAFDALRSLLEQKQDGSKKVVFIDEMPWMDHAKSNFVSAIERFWNGWAAHRDDILLIACGSATSWIADKLIFNTGGLHNRVTKRIYLRPFTLQETEEYLRVQGCQWDRFQVAQCYMALGGVPWYLSLLHADESLAQNIDRLFFRKNSDLREEFAELYHSLFNRPENYISIVKALAGRLSGMTRQEISKHIGLTGSGLTRLLENLERCDFILGYRRFGSKRNGVVYRLSDFYTLFYFRFVADDRSYDEQWWEHHLTSPQIITWQGYSFELLSMIHLQQIKQALGINGIASDISTWRSTDANHPYQIDLIIDRADRIVNLCEMKFSVSRYVIERDYEQRLRDRLAVFLAETKTRKSPLITFVTTYGVLPGRHSGVVQNQVTLDDLFLPNIVGR